jgi:hypothetical protein
MRSSREKSYSLGFEGAIQVLAHSYWKGFGVTKDKEKALQLYEKAYKDDPSKDVLDRITEIRSDLVKTKSNYEIEAWKQKYLNGEIVLEVKILNFLPHEKGSLVIEFEMSQEVPVSILCSLLCDGNVIQTIELENLKKSCFECMLPENGKHAYQVVVDVLV